MMKKTIMALAAMTILGITGRASIFPGQPFLFKQTAAADDPNISLFVQWLDFNVTYLQQQQFQDYSNTALLNQVAEQNVNAFYQSKKMRPLPYNPYQFIYTSQDTWFVNLYRDIVKRSSTEQDFVSKLAAGKMQIAQQPGLTPDDIRVYGSMLDLFTALSNYCTRKDANNSSARMPIHASSLNGAMIMPWANADRSYGNWWRRWGKCLFGTMASQLTGSIAGCGTGAGIGAAIGSIAPGVGTGLGAAVGCGIGSLAGGVAGALNGISNCL